MISRDSVPLICQVKREYIAIKNKEILYSDAE